jgi:hypothetical protein
VPVSVEAGSALGLERFWRWVKEHSDCILRAGTPETYLYDHEQVHWHLGEDSDRNFVVQLVWGKQIIGEMLLAPREVLFVQAAPDPESEQPGRFIFELIGGSKEEPYPLYHFLMAHAFEEEGTQHGPLKH